MIDPLITKEHLVKLFGEVNAIQLIISIGFKDFVERFIALESTGTEVLDAGGSGGTESD